ncbi:MAG: response regulator [Bryobacteraceae bacterium]
MAPVVPDNGLSLLLVEDSAVLAERLCELLSGIEGIHLAGIADSEASALEALAKNPIDLILLDLHLRQGTGFGVLKEINKRPERPVVIIFTNYDLKEYRRAAMALGARYFLDKSSDMDHLPKLIESIRDGKAA